MSTRWFKCEILSGVSDGCFTGIQHAGVWNGYGSTFEGSIETWAAVARDNEVKDD